MSLQSIKQNNKAILYAKRIWRSKDTSFCKTLEKAASQYCDKEPSVDKKRLIAQMHRAYRKYALTPGEFEDFKLFDKTDEAIKEYISREELLRKFGNGKRNHFPKDKFQRYSIFSDCYHRDVILIEDSSEKNAAKYTSFLKNKSAFIAKPIRGAKGKGIEIITKEAAPDILTLQKCTEFPVMLEELIDQGKELGYVHPQSVNTVRVVSAMTKENKGVILYALFRCGRDGSVVDNVGSGGMIMLVGMEDGKVCTDGLCAHEYYKEHPNTGVVFRDIVIPDWDRLLETARKAHGLLPKQALIGWDFAWTTTGWDLVEANPAPAFASWQTLSGKGIRPRLTELGVL